MTKTSKSSLRWQCRRGMLELDILLNDFINKHEADLSAQDASVLERLLAYPDQVMLNLLLGNTTSSDMAIQNMVERIRDVQGKMAQSASIEATSTEAITNEATTKDATAKDATTKDAWEGRKA